MFHEGNDLANDFSQFLKDNDNNEKVVKEKEDQLMKALEAKKKLEEELERQRIERQEELIKSKIRENLIEANLA